jgi:hypothetical protein
MPFHFECPKCREKYDVADDMVGKTILCRKCEQRVPVRPPATRVAPVAAGGQTPTRRKALLIALGIVPGVFLGVAGTYYRHHRFPWEYREPSTEFRGRRRGPPPDAQAADGQPADGQPAAGQPDGGQRGGGRRGGRGGRGRGQGGQGGQGNPPAPMP